MQYLISFFDGTPHHNATTTVPVPDSNSRPSSSYLGPPSVSRLVLEIDGSDGGGQLLRSSLALSAVTETPVRVENVRGDRPEPGLNAQHLTAVQVLGEVCDADVEGDSLGSETVTFIPDSPGGGHVETSVGTAGSLTLLFDAVLPVAVALDSPLTVTASGGTAVEWSPPLSTYRQVKFPLCRTIGLNAVVERHHSGFYPAGGGEATLHLAPSTLSPIELTERGAFVGARIYSRASHDLAERDVATRQAATAREMLEAEAIPILEQRTVSTAADSSGTVLTVELAYENTAAGFDELGEPGKPAEEVATDAVEDALTFHDGEAVVDRHLADQLLVFIALAGGRVCVPALTDHVESSLDLLDSFGFDLVVDSSGALPGILGE